MALAPAPATWGPRAADRGISFKNIGFWPDIRGTLPNLAGVGSRPAGLRLRRWM